MSEKPITDKGGQMEEVLRHYFLDQGYYVVRGPKYSFGSDEITDVDLWLYQRGSSFSRQRFNVDIKNKRTPQAMERILWAKGIKECLRLDGVLVATTDSRAMLKEFGDRNGVIVLDGTLLAKLKKHYATETRRLTDEELENLVRTSKGDRIGEEWADRLEHAKSRILTQLDFDGCNALLDHLGYFAEQIITVPNRTEASCRLFYLTLSLAIITLDFIVKDFALIDRSLQVKSLNEGLRFGTIGKAGADKMLGMASSVAAAYLKDRKISGKEILKQLRDESLQLPVDILTEFILKINSGRNLFEVARGLDSLAFARDFKTPNRIHSDYRSVIGAVLDFLQFERKRFFDAFRDDSEHQKPPQEATESSGPLQDQPELPIGE